MAVVLALAMVATACSSDDVGGAQSVDRTATNSGDVIQLGDDEIVLASALGTLPNCDALLDYLRVEGANRVGPYGFDGDGWFGPMFDDIAFDGDGAMDDEAMEEASDAAGDAADAVTDTSSSAPASTSSAGFNQSAPVVPMADEAGAVAEKAVEGVDFSGTTVQELGIDEPDIIKTNGDRILVISNGVFSVIDTRGEEALLAGQTRFGGETYIREMLIVGDRALLFGESWGYGGGPVPLPAIAEPAIAVEDSGDAEAGFAQAEPFVEGQELSIGSDGPTAMMIEIDLANEAQPAVTGRIAVEGRYLSARLVGGIARVAVQSNPNQLPFVFPRNSSGEDAARNANRDAVAQSELEDWLPTYLLERDGAVVEQGLLTGCDRVHVPSTFSGFGSLSLLSFDLSEPLGNGLATTVMASGETVYASDSSVYLATNNWFDPALSVEDRSQLSEAYTTSLHSFDITGAAANYSASGSVRGHLLNQFAMSEHNGHLRVATTDGTPWGDDSTSESFVQVLERQADELVVIGSVGDMGRGETIRSVRFVGDIAYIVTFRQTDPFYTVDLSEPTAPVVRGELKITGYSGQLHPIGPDLVLGIGQEATEQGRTTGAKMTLFDVSNLDAPVDLDTWTLPNAYTEAEWDHRSFLWWAPENLAVFPINSWSENFWGAVAFRVDRENGISEFGRIDHGDDGEVEVGRTECEVLSSERLRELQAGIGEDNELFWFFEEFSSMAEGEGQVQRCGGGQGGADGLSCYEEFPVDMLREFGVDRVDLGLGPDDRFEICWPAGPGDDPIIRTLVIRDELWSLSYGSLQSNLLADLSRTQQLSIQ